jgi:spore coat polysaccharide biosynthesis protein SpsF
MTKIDAAIIVQARMGSSRLPGKIAFPLAGKSMLSHIISRLQFADVGGPVIVATSTEAADDSVPTLIGSEASYSRGSEEDVLDRFWQAAKHLDNKYIVRATADNPLVWEGAIEHLWQTMKDGEYDYATFDGKLPIGMAVEMFSKEALAQAQAEATDPRHREHVTPFFYSQPERFRCYRATPPEHVWGDFRLTVDTENDYELMKIIYQRFFSPAQIIPAVDVINMLKEEPKLAQMNSNIHQKSFKE